MNDRQNRDNIPVELSEMRQWLPKIRGRKHAPTGWNDPQNWKELDEIEGAAIFNSNNTEFLIIDGDSVFDERGKLYAPIKEFLTQITLAGGAETYYEHSQSGRGLHIIYDLSDYPGEPLKADIVFNDLPANKEGKKPHVEFYYRQSHLFFLTGNMFNNSAERILNGEGAAEAMRKCIQAIQDKNGRKDKSNKSFKLPDKIQSGKRNDYLFRLSCSLQAQGLPDNAIIAAVEKTNELSCDDPLDDKELQNLINSALRYEKGNPARGKDTLKPKDYTDIGQATVFRNVYGDIVRYSLATDFLVYDGIKWIENPVKAVELAQRLTGDQLKEAEGRIKSAQDKLIEVQKNGNDKKEVDAAKEEMSASKKYFSFVLTRRDNRNITNTLMQARPMLQIRIEELDADPYLLNTPGGAVDLKTGAIRTNNPQDYCTKVTAVSPSAGGKDVFHAFLDRLTGGNTELIDYLQMVAGMCAIGQVKQEKLIIAYGDGGNGKSTFFNLLFRVFGDYSGMLSAETLTTGQRNNKKPELAELRGKRLIIAAELEEGTRMDTATVKKLCSTDPIHAEKKFKDPFQFFPSHTMILYTNHIPKVGTNDAGTWSRLVIVPFTQKLRGATGEVKNYADFLFQRAGGAVLQWTIEGAKRFIEADYMIKEPLCVAEATNKYREDNDWLSIFIEECCDVNVNFKAPAGALYDTYKRYCIDNGEYIRNQLDFKHAMESAGYINKKGSGGKRFYIGILEKSDFRRMKPNEQAPFKEGA